VAPKMRALISRMLGSFSYRMREGRGSERERGEGSSGNGKHSEREREAHAQECHLGLYSGGPVELQSGLPSISCGTNLPQKPRGIEIAE
jgi:hypothetical protein